LRDIAVEGNMSTEPASEGRRWTEMDRIRADSPSDLVLLLLYANEQQGARTWSGVTRLQKLAFLASVENGYQGLVQAGEAPALRFEAYKMGPFTSELYDAVQTLTGFDPPLVLASAGTVGGQDDVETAHYVEEIDLDYPGAFASTPRPTTFTLTPAGEQVAKRLWSDAPEALRRLLQELVGRYGRMPLRQLLRYVYKTHPDKTINSEIKAQLGLS
jgi:hypothetical protein